MEVRAGMTPQCGRVPPALLARSGRSSYPAVSLPSPMSGFRGLLTSEGERDIPESTVNSGRVPGRPGRSPGELPRWPLQGGDSRSEESAAQLQHRVTPQAAWAGESGYLMSVESESFRLTGVGPDAKTTRTQVLPVPMSPRALTPVARGRLRRGQAA